MGTGPEYLDAEKFAAWITPGEAKTRSGPGVGGTFRAEEFIADLLGDGMVRAAAAHAIVKIPGQNPHRTERVLIPAHHLAAMSPVHGNEIWDASTLEVWTEHGSTRIKYYGIRIDPDALAQMLPLPQTPPKPKPITGAEAYAAQAAPPLPKLPVLGLNQPEDDPPQKGPAVSQAALEAWRATFEIAFQGAENTLANAYKSAEGMFPGKFVARQRIRDLLKGRKAGRKAKTAK